MHLPLIPNIPAPARKVRNPAGWIAPAVLIQCYSRVKFCRFDFLGRVVS